jgi:parallel beta-helix repeat protein
LIRFFIPPVLAPPAGWSSLALPVPTAIKVGTLIRAWSVSSPNIVEMYSNNNNPATDLLLISPELANINQSMVRFYAGTSTSQTSPILVVGTMTNPTDPSTFVAVRSFPSLSYVGLDPYLVGLSGCDPNARHIAFRHGTANLGDGKAIYIDNFSFETLPACVEPSGLIGTGISPNSALIDWDENGLATRWEVKYGPINFNPDNQGAALFVDGQSTCLIDALAQSTEYQFYVRALCNETLKSPWAGPALFRTTQVPIAAPFTENFEGESAQDWDRVNGNYVNQWYVGNATSFEGSKSAYISNNNGVSNQYTTTPPATFRVHLFRDVIFPATPGRYTLKYWVKGIMESSDYLRVHFMETSVVPVAGEFLPMSYYIGEGQVTNNSNWTEKTIALPEGLEGQTRRLVFSWTCNNRNGTQPPTAIDNVQILFEAFGSISGTVVEPGGQPAAGARIIAGDFSGTADEEGKFRIGGVPAGTYDVWCEAGGMATVFATAELTEGGTANIEFNMDHEHKNLPQTISYHSEIPDIDGFRQTATDGRFLYSPDFTTTLHIFDLIDPANPVKAGTKTITGIGGAFYHRNLFVGSSGDRLEIFDCTNPASLFPLSTWFIYGNAKEMAFNGNHAFVVASQPGSQSILRVADCSDPSNVSEISGTILSFGGNARMQIDSERNLLYILGISSTFLSQLFIFDISSPASPALLSTQVVNENVQGMVLSDGYVIVTFNHDESVPFGATPSQNDEGRLQAPQGVNTQGYFQVWDTQDPLNPLIILVQALGIKGNIMETSIYNGTILAYVLPEMASSLLLITFYFDALIISIFQGISLDKVFWFSNLFTFLSEPIQQLKSQSLTEENSSTETFYAVTIGGNSGGSSPPQSVIKVTRNPGEQHTLTMSITPAEAAADGCTVSPGVGVHTYSEVTPVPLSYTNSNNWVFKEWQGPAAGNSVEVNGNVAVAGVFEPKPVLTVSGNKEKELIYPCDLTGYTGFYPAGAITFTADETDDWNVNGFTLEASGTADDINDIFRVKVTWLNNEYELTGIYNMDNGTLKVDLNPALRIPKSSSSTASIYYDFEVPDDYASDSARSFLWKTKNVRATPLNFEEYVIIGSAKMDSLIAARIHTSGGYYFTHVYEIDETGTDEHISNGDTVWVCAGTYTESDEVHIEKEITLKSYSGREYTFIQDNTFYLQNSNITIDGFTFELIDRSVIIYVYTFSRSDVFSNITITNNKFTSIQKNTFDSNSESNAIVLFDNYNLFGEGTIKNISISNNNFNKINTCIKIGEKECPVIDGLVVDGNQFIGSMFRSFDNNSIVTISNNLLKEEIVIRNNTFYMAPLFLNNLEHISLLNVIGNYGDSYKHKISDCNGKLVISQNEQCSFFIVNESQKDNTYTTTISENINCTLIIYDTKFLTVQNNSFSSGSGYLELIKCENFWINDNTLNWSFISSTECKDGTIQGNRINGATTSLDPSIKIGHSEKILVQDNQILNGKTGISVENSEKINIKENRMYRNLTGIYMDKVSNSVIYNNSMRDDGAEFEYGIYLKNSHDIKAYCNSIFGSCTGFEAETCENVNFSNNYITEAFCLFTGLKLNQSSGVITGNAIINNHGNGVAFIGGSSFLVQNNNIFGNKPYGLNNEQGTKAIDASGNYWGNEGGPGDNAFSDNVEVGDWLPSSVKLNVVFSEDEKYSPSGSADSIMAFVQNLTEINDTIQITVSDAKGWHTGEKTFDLQFDDSTGTSLYIPYEIPAGVLDSSLFTVTARSHLDNSWQATGQIPVFSYHPVPDRIVVFLDSIALPVTDTIQFSTTIFDQQGNYLHPELEWQSSIGAIDSTGTFYSNGDTGICVITAKAKKTNVSGQATVRIWENDPIVSSLKIDPDSIVLVTGQSQLFNVIATDDQGFRTMATNINWSSTIGVINDWGNFVADTLPNNGKVIALDTLHQVSDSAKVFIAEMQVVELRTAPILVSPVDGSIQDKPEIYFEWKPDHEADYYIFELATDPVFENLVEFVGTHDNFILQKNLNEVTTYYWRISAVNQVGVGDESEIWGFNIEIEDTVNINRNPTLSDVKVYPNPTRNLLNIEFPNQNNQPVSAMLMNLKAQILYSKTYSNHEKNSIQMNLSEFENGIYLLRIKTGEEILLRKILKE